MITWQFSKQLASITSSLRGGTTEFEIRYRRAKGNPCVEGEPYLVPKYKKKQLRNGNETSYDKEN